MVELSCRVGTADDDGGRQGPRPAARPGHPVGPAPAAGPGADAAVDLDVAGFFAGGGRHDPGAGVTAAVGRRWSRRRWAIGLGVGTVGASVAMAATVLVVVRWPDHGDAGRAGALDAALGSSLAADLVMSVATWIEYVAVLLLVGGAAFRLFVSRPPVTGRGTSERVLLAAAAVGSVACLGTVPLRAMVLSGRGLGSIVERDTLGLVLTSRFGDAACLRLVALMLFGLALARPPRGWERRVRVIRPGATVLMFGSVSTRTIERVMCAGASMVALASFSMVGHPQATDPRGPLMAAQAAHVLAAGVWFGGGLLLALEIARQRHGGTARCSAETVARFSTVAGVALVLVAVTGTVLARSQLASAGALVSTGYGRALVAKLALVGLVVALGAYNHYRLVPVVVVEDDAVAWRLLGHTAAVEAMTIGVGILIATAAMTSGGL